MNLSGKIFFLVVMLFMSSALAQNMPDTLTAKQKMDSLKSNVKLLPELLNNPEVYPNEYEQRKESFTSSYLFKGLIAGTVALGVTAAYFKLKADDRFDQYKKSKEQKYLDDTRKFDWYSGISFSVLQVNLGFLIYYFLIE